MAVLVILRSGQTSACNYVAQMKTGAKEVAVERIDAATPNPRARTTGCVYLLYFLTAILGQTLASPRLMALGEALTLISFGFYVVLSLLFYLLFKPVSRLVSLIAALFSLVGCGLGVLGLFHRAPAQVTPLWFFGRYCIMIGYLILRSTFLPRLLGWLMVIAGFAWVAYLLPQVAKLLSIPIEGLGILAEAALMLWLLVKGVNVARWTEQASAARKYIRA